MQTVKISPVSKSLEQTPLSSHSRKKPHGEQIDRRSMFCVFEYFINSLSRLLEVQISSKLLSYFQEGVKSSF